MFGCPTNISDIEHGIESYGISSNSSQMLLNELKAANESILTGIYITFVPNPSCQLNSLASDEIRDGTGQCCRISSSSICICGHDLNNHHDIKLSKSGGYNKPPTCQRCKSCKGYSYIPALPEECGQWWLSRRKDFDIEQWRKRIRNYPHEYACIGCEMKISDHETIFESLQDRKLRNAIVDQAYIPLQDQQNIVSLITNNPRNPRKLPQQSRIKNPVRYQLLTKDTSTDIDKIKNTSMIHHDNDHQNQSNMNSSQGNSMYSDNKYKQIQINRSYNSFKYSTS